MTSPAKGLMYDVSPTRVSLVGHPANRREFLVMKNEQENIDMEKILEVIKDTESDNEASLVETMKASGSGKDAIDAVVGIKRVLHAFRDVLSEADFTGLAESANFKVKKVEIEPVGSNEPTDDKAKDNEVQKRNEEIKQLSDEVTRLTNESRDVRLKKLASEVKVGDQDSIFKTLVTVYNSGGDVDAVLEVLKTQSAAALEGIDTAVGSDREGQLDTGFDAIKAEATRIAEEKGITYYEALDIVDKTNRPLTLKYYEENK